MESTSNIIIALFSAETIRLDEDSVAKVLAGDYPIRVKSKILACIRENIVSTPGESIVGFYPVVKPTDSDSDAKTSVEDITQDHYGDLALYITPELPCKVVSNLIAVDIDGHIVCRENLVRGHGVIVISDSRNDWNELLDCLEKSGADSIKCISIVNQ